MLGSITRALSEIYTRLGSRPFVAEAKLDGQRGQIHVSTTEPVGEKGKGSWYDPLPGTEGKRVWVRVFSRHLLEMTDKYPDIAYTLSALVHRESTSSQPLTDFIIDCEIVAIDPASGAFKTFQELSYRSRKDVEMGDIKVRVGIYAFDLMYLNGKSLLGEPFRKRREMLRDRFAPMRPEDLRLAKWELIPSCTDNEPDKVRAFFEETLKMRAEGIMVKLLDEAEIEVASDAEEDGVDARGQDESALAEEAEFHEESHSDVVPSPSKSKKGSGKRRKTLPATYEPDKRADSWLKVKKDYLE
jgi:DNA ligase-1